jgi:hypothetical protein
MDLYAIATAIAGQFAGMSVTSGTETMSLASAPTPDLPDAITKGPVILVFPPEGELSIGVSALNQDVYDFPVRWLRDPLNYPARSRWVWAWQTAMRYKVEANMDLGLAYVAWAKAVATRAGVDIGEYNGVAKYDLVEYIIRVRINEVATALAP